MSERATAPDAGSPPVAAPRLKPRRWADLLPRVLSGLVMVAAALGTALVGGHSFALFWLLAAAAVVWEWQRLVAPQGAMSRFAVGAAALAVAVALLRNGLWLPALGVLAIGAIAAGALTGAGQRAMGAAGVIYAGALLLSVVVLRASEPGGVATLLWLFAVVWGTDVMAYFGGRLIGGPKLWPRLSPSKTWSGFLVGVTSGALAGLAVSPPGSSRGAVLAIGLLAGVLAQAGDFLESAIKRHYGVKDTSHLIPGHGGVMDRLDGFIVAAAFAACLGVAHGGLDAAGAGLFNWQ